MPNTPTAARMREVFDLIEHTVEHRWGIPVRIADVPSPFTGDLDGASIAIDYDNDIEDALFILVHLFGHTVQWNTSLRAREIGTRRPTETWTAAELRELADYEIEACQLSLALLHSVGVTDLDQWLSDFAACDAAYLMHFYSTGEKRPFRGFWKSHSKMLQPAEIPEFSPASWISRFDGIVV
jgi:hypothetical protein